MTDDKPSAMILLSDLINACMVVCLAGLVVSTLYRMTNYELGFALCGTVMLLMILGYCCVSDGCLRLSPVDYSILALWVSDAVSAAASLYGRNSFEALLSLAFSTIIFLLFRGLLLYWPASRWGVLIVSVAGGIFAINEGRRASIWFNAAALVGFKDISQLKAHSLAMSSNDLSSILLLLLPFAFLATALVEGRRLKVLLLTIAMLINGAVLYALFLTFSRGAYLGACVFGGGLLIGACVVGSDLKNITKSFAGSIVIALLAVCISAPSTQSDLIKMVFLKESISQKRSADGHIVVWRASLAMASSRIMLGIGPGNFAMRYAAQGGRDVSRPPVIRPLNLPLEVLVERGVLGIVLFSTFVGAVLWTECRCVLLSRGKATCSVVRISAFVAILVREFTYSSLLTSPWTSLLFCLLIATCTTEFIMVTRPMGNSRLLCGPNKCVDAWKIGLTGVLLSACIAIFYFGFVHLSAVDEAHDAIRYWDRDLDRKALGVFDLAINHDPDNAYLISMLGLEKGRMALRFPKTKRSASNIVGEKSDQVQLLAESIAAYLRAFQSNPFDATFANNLGWLYFYKGDISTADRYLRNAIALDPGEAMFHYGLASVAAKENLSGEAHTEYIITTTLRPEFINSSAFRLLKGQQPQEANRIVIDSISALRSGNARSDDPVAMARLGALLLKSGYVEESVAPLENAVEDLPDLYVAWWNLSVAFRKLGKLSEADLALRKASFLCTRFNTSQSISDLAKDVDRKIKGEPDIAESQLFPFASEHAKRIGSIYKMQPLVYDDLLPPGFLRSSMFPD
jgi:tetratricopeptide (TPR) repeat protein